MDFGVGELFLVALLLVAFVLLVAILFYLKWQPSRGSEAAVGSGVSLQGILATLKNRSESAEALERACEQFDRHFWELNPSQEDSLALLNLLVVHPKTSSKLILAFEKNLKKNLPSATGEIEKVMKKALNKR